MSVRSNPEVSAFLSKLWTSTLGVDAINPRDSFFGLGGNSMSLVTMLVGVSNHYELDLDYEEFFADPCLETLVALVHSGLQVGEKVPR